MLHGTPKKFPKIFQKFLQSEQDTIDQNQLKNQIYLLRFGHTNVLLFEKIRHKMDKIPALHKLTHMLMALVPKNTRNAAQTVWLSENAN